MPNLITLNLTSNNITSLSTLVALEHCTNLRYLNLGDNPVKNHDHYREFVVWKVSLSLPHCGRVADIAKQRSLDLIDASGKY